MQVARPTASLPLERASGLYARLRAIPGATIRWAHPGQVLLPEGEAPPCLYVVECGAIVLSLTARSGRRAAIAVIGPNHMFGAESLFLASGADPSDGQSSMYPEARAFLPSRVVSLGRSNLLAALERDGPFAALVAISMAGRIRDLCRRLAGALVLPVRHRLLDLLTDLAHSFGRRVETGIRIDLPLTQEELASMVGATRESVNRALRDLVAERLIDRSGGSYVLRAEDSSGMVSRRIGLLSGPGTHRAAGGRS